MGDITGIKGPQAEIQELEKGAQRFLTNDVEKASWERWR
jgi:hypothetical protein